MTYPRPRPGPHRERTPALYAKAAVMYLSENKSLFDIGLELGCCGAVVRDLLTEAGIPIRKRGSASSDSRKYTAERIAERRRA